MGKCIPNRRGYCNGSYTCDLVTAARHIEDLQVPKDWKGEFHSQGFERYRYYEPEVAETLTQMFVSDLFYGILIEGQSTIGIPRVKLIVR